MREILSEGRRRREITLGGASGALAPALTAIGFSPQSIGELVVVEVDGDDAVKAVVERALADGAALEGVVPKRETLEDLFVRRAF